MSCWCCCCCPPAIQALAGLYVRSGCRQAVVAGALTFFPPSPALYEFARQGAAPHEFDSNSENQELPETKGQTERQLQSPMEQLAASTIERQERARRIQPRDERDWKQGVTFQLLLDPRLVLPSQFRDDLVKAVKIPVFAKKKEELDYMVAAVWYAAPHPTAATPCIIYSHGNATDVGAMFQLQVLLAHTCNVHVVSYDYAGYGESGGVPDEQATYADLQAVYDYCLEHVVTSPTQIVLYGQSVGGGPCCHLASRMPVGGLVLHAAFTSGMRVLTESRLLACLDIYPNLDRITAVSCPVWVLHGRLDQEIPFAHGQALQQAVPVDFQTDPWWIPDRGHNDVTDGKLAEYMRRLRSFLRHCQHQATAATAVGADDPKQQQQQVIMERGNECHVVHNEEDGPHDERMSGGSPMNGTAIQRFQAETAGQQS